MTRIVLVDDQQLLRRGLRLLLSTQDGIEVVGEFASGAETLAWLRSNPAPDVVVSDAQMPGMSGLELVAALADRYPDLPVLILTTFDDVDLVQRAVRAGVAGFLLKDTSPELLAEAIRASARGQVTIDPRVAAAALGRDATRDPLGVLTPTERRVAQFIARGARNGDIAAELVLTVGTVKNHVSSILHKLGYEDRTALALRLQELLRT